MKVQVVGLGNVGLPTAVHVSKTFEVVGCDVSSRAREKASRFITTVPSLQKADVYIVDVDLKVQTSDLLDMTSINDVCSEISKLSPDALVSIESTVPVGTCRDVSKRHSLSILVHCPHRFWSFDPVRYGVVQTRILGALNEESLQRAKKFYGALKVPIHVVSSLEVAELTKLAENSYRFVEIAFAESLAIACNKHGFAFDEVRNACNTLKRREHGYQIQVLEAKKGIEGGCLPKDIQYLLALDESLLLKGAIAADAEYKRRIAIE